MTLQHLKSHKRSRSPISSSKMVNGSGLTQHTQLAPGVSCHSSSHTLMIPLIDNSTTTYPGYVICYSLSYYLLNIPQVCIQSENAVGYIKGQFQPLQGLCQQINSTCDHPLALAWVHTCVIIHTLAAQYEEAEKRLTSGSGFMMDFSINCMRGIIVSQSTILVGGMGRQQLLVCPLLNRSAIMSRRCYLWNCIHESPLSTSELQKGAFIRV